MRKMIAFSFLVLLIMFMLAGYNTSEVESSNQTGNDVQASANDNTYYLTQESIEAHKILVSQEQKTEEQKTEEQKPEEQKPEEQPQPTEEKGRKIDPKKPMVALTFDDGPHPKYTGLILDSLKKHNGLATFFILGSRAEKYKSVVGSIAANGNQIGNHTYDHKKLTSLSSEAIKDELKKTSDAIFKIVSLRPEVMRPTYGSVNDQVKQNAGTPLILWSIDTRDWQNKNKTAVVNAVVGKVKDGDIILMHDIYKTTAEAAAVIIEKLSAKGYQLVTIDELYAAKGITLASGKVYANAR